MNTKNIIVAVLVLLIVASVAYLFLKEKEVKMTDEPITTEETVVVDEVNPPVDEIPEVEKKERGEETEIGSSVSGTKINAYHLGTGDTEILLVGGTHGSYSPNTSALANEAIRYFKENPSTIPDNVTLTIIPTLNPDGLAMTGTDGRFNENEVDLNRNFDCEWSETGVWRNQEVSGGSEAFSEPESIALRDYVEANDPAAAIVLFSAEGKVYPSACETVPSKASVELAATYAVSAGYPADAEFDAYAITGDMVNWMAKQGIPAISVLLTDHTNTEWAKNKAGIEAVLKAYSE